jgi:L-seryl-tRNA(Ser) seleniumtransferase
MDRSLSPRPPGVERLIAATRHRLGGRDHAAVVAAARDVVADERRRMADGGARRPIEELADLLVARLEGYEDGTGGDVRPVINATGVLLHTNLGRAPWPAAAVRAAAAAAGSYSLLELDAASGRRGRRAPSVEDDLVALTGAEAALVTTNNAAAVALAVGLAGRGGVLVSRGELVEIGGGVRIPEIVRRTGARLIEVGTTNRTRVADFAAPLAEGRARIILRVHRSNFAMSGFVEAPDPSDLAALAHAHGALIVDDLGSGALIDTAAFGLGHEPMPSERLAAGADVVTFSGDKLVGGPQAGLIVGRADLVARLRRDPLARAVRADKAVLAGLGATLALYLAGRAVAEIPVWRMIGATPQSIRERAEGIVEQLGDLAAFVVPVESTVGGGSLPGDVLPSFGIALELRSPDAAAASLRARDPAVVARVAEGALLLDLRTVDPADDARLEEALRSILAAVRTT